MEEDEADAELKQPELEMVDALIAGLEALIHESDETPLSIGFNQPSRRAVYRIINLATPSDRKLTACDAVYLDGSRLILRCNNTEVVRLTPLEVMVLAEKSGRGETVAVVRGKADTLKRVRGGYDIEITIAEMRKTRITPTQKLREFLDAGDTLAWNRWCQDITDTVELMGMDLQHADLSGCDLCCADLSGSNLSGANLSNAVLAGADLSNCNLEGAVVTGADFFRATMRRDQASLLQHAGMPEVESVFFVG